MNHFKPDVSKVCTFCRDLNSDELISHIFWFCPYISDLINEIIDFVNSKGIEFNPTKSEFLFGNTKVQAYSVKNFIPLVLKKYIWRSKFKTATVTMVGFKAQLKSYLCDLKYMLEYKNHGTVQKVVVLSNRTMQMLVRNHRKGGIRQCAVR